MEAEFKARPRVSTATQAAKLPRMGCLVLTPGGCHTCGLTTSGAGVSWGPGEQSKEKGGREPSMHMGHREGQGQVPEGGRAGLWGGWPGSPCGQPRCCACSWLSASGLFSRASAELSGHKHPEVSILTAAAHFQPSPRRPAVMWSQPQMVEVPSAQEARDCKATPAERR